MLSLCIHTSCKTFRPVCSTLGDVGHVCNAYDSSESFDKLKRALTSIVMMCFLWSILCVANYFHFCEGCSRSFDKLL